MLGKGHWLGLVLAGWLALVPWVTQAAPKDNFTRVTLKNGMTVMYQVMKDQPMVAMYAVFPIGLNGEKAKGIAHLLEHMVFRGGSGYSFQDIANVTNRKGGYFNGFTSFFATAYYYVVPKDNFREAFAVFNGSLWQTELAEPIVKLERKIVLHELDMDYSSRLPYYPIFKYFYPELSYTKETVAAISAGDLKEFHTQYYQPANATYVITGDFDPKQVLADLALVKNGHGGVNGSVTAEKVVNEIVLPKREVVEERNLYPYQFQVMMSYEFDGLNETERLILNLLSYIYGSDYKIDYEHSNFKNYFVLSRSVGSKDYFSIYYLEQEQPFSEAAYQQEKQNLLKYFREFKKGDFQKEVKNFITEIEYEVAASQASAEDAAQFKVQQMIDPYNITSDSIAQLKKLKAKDLENFIDQYFSKPPTAWVLVKTTDAGGNQNEK